MNSEMRLKILENVYVSVLVDSIYHFSRQGVLDKVTEDKRRMQILMGKKQVEQFRMTKAEDVFIVLSEVFNCASWEIEQTDKGFEAKAKTCRLCAYAKKLESESPCNIYCLNPMEGMIQGINPKLKFEVSETLWSGKKCRVNVSRK
ncbi:L-2-amino-thiazoline-4-carboxylic acid hydrolase [Wukongibacter baidiensis]|uniref:L-2-amino-thiazoline-4-carboxylic acid hydrolase n=1 Tax=Wukongibacter baidiensis TaxID=1723361 RepID=UPI003D7F2BCB